ncbi:hypothetical protein [Aquimarina sediminis]|nr:hypothetical protein [Aquimarina sediminis]
MINNILNLEGVSVLNKNMQQTVQGGGNWIPCGVGEECWEHVH